MLFRIRTRCSTYFCFQYCGLNKQIVKLLNEHTDNIWFFPDCACQSYYATIEPELQNLENSNKLVLDKLKNSISNSVFNDFADLCISRRISRS